MSKPASFDHFFAIDWSSRTKPSPVKPTRDAIWLAEAMATGRVTVRYFRTRQQTLLYLERRLGKLLAQNKRVFLGWDFAFGYPKGLGKALKIKKKRAWKHIWRLLDKLILDRDNNDNNRFTVGAELNRRISVGSGPFWGVSRGQSGIFLGAKKDFRYPVINKRAVLAERRLVEERVPKMQSPWKLAYAGSVGSQSLLGIPRLYQLRFCHKALKKQSRIWPFETKFADDLPQGACVIHAEIYPSMVAFGKDKIPDRAQVRAYVKWLQRTQTEGKLSAYLAGPENLTQQQRKKVLREEGWVFGVE